MTSHKGHTGHDPDFILFISAAFVSVADVVP